MREQTIKIQKRHRLTRPSLRALEHMLQEKWNCLFSNRLLSSFPTVQKPKLVLAFTVIQVAGANGATRNELS